MARLGRSFPAAAGVRFWNGRLITATTFSLTADVAAFTLSGQAALFAENFVCDRASFALAGQATALSPSLTSNVGSYTLSAQSLLFAENFVVSSASFTLSGQAASLYPGVIANVGSYALSGQTVLFAENFVAAFGSYTLSGQAVGLFPTTNFTVDFASYSLSGQSVGFVEAYKVTANFAPFALSGQTVAFNLNMVVSQASFALSGQSINLGPSIPCSPGSFALVGFAVRDVQGPTGDHIFLVEFQGHNGSTATSFYMATEGWASAAADTPASQFYNPRVKDPGNFERHISVRDDGSGTAASSGDVVLLNGSPGNTETLDTFIDGTYGFDGRSITIKALPVGSTRLSSALIMHRGIIDHITSTKPLDQLEVKFSDLLGDLELPLLTTKFAGTTTSTAATAEGNADLAGQIKQVVWGSVINIPLQAANVYDLIYLASNSSVVSIAAYDGGVALTNDGDFASIALLRAATIVPGHYATCLALGLIRLGGTAAFAVTADVVEGANAAARTAAQIAKRMLVTYGISTASINLNTFTALDVKNAAVCGILIKDDRTVHDAAKTMLASIGGRLLPSRDGLYEVFRIEAPSVGTVFEDYQLGDDFQLSDTLIPAWRINLNYGEVFQVQADGDLAGVVSAARRATLASQYRTITVEDSSIKTKHLKAVELTFTTCLTSAADASTEATRLLALYSAERRQYQFSMPLSDAFYADVGISITLQMNRIGMSSGKNFLVIGREDIYAVEQIHLTVWG